ncbi:MAG: DegV family protein [Thermoleophilia bacterium]|nr:DegV family protein [Thermoleophilia bacterium]MDH5281709.1 DegV family protein [Thermoleophilia bacterium]
MNLNTENTAVVLDSTSDYPEAPSRFPNMRFVPLYVRFGDDTYRDYVELGPAEFYEKLRTSPVTPATAQPTPQDFVDAYEELAAYERIYSLHVSSKVSGTFQSAELAAQEIGGDKIRVVDSLTASLAIAMLSHAIQRRLARGTTDEEIEALIGRFHRDAEVLFTVETLEYLQRGGRIGRAAALAGSLLNVRPILGMDDGVVIAVSRVRGPQKALAEIERRFVEATTDGRGLRVAIAHADASEWVGTLSEIVWRTRPKAEIEFTATLGAVVGTHAGPGAVGFFWFQDE